MELIDIKKSEQTTKGFDKTNGGRVIYVHAETGERPFFLPTELNKDFEDNYYHGYFIEGEQ